MLSRLNIKILIGGRFSIARPRALSMLWLACHNRLATKDRLCKIGILNEDCRYFYRDKEIIQYLMFACEETKKIWKEILEWLQVGHKAQSWNEELSWIVQHRKGKWWRTSIFKCAIAETFYAVWNYRNYICFGN